MKNLIYTNKSNAQRALRNKGLTETHIVEPREGGGFEIVQIKKEPVKTEGRTNSKKAKRESLIQNEIKAPTNRSKELKAIWDTLTEQVIHFGKIPTLKEARELLASRNKTTIGIQYYRWKRFNGYNEKTK